MAQKAGNMAFLVFYAHITPVIVKYPFWQMTNDNPKAIYACLNYNEAYCPKQIEKQSIVIDGDSGNVIRQLL